MAIFNKHREINLDATFENNHKELFKVFSDNNLDVEISDDFNGLKFFLTSLSKEEYPYNFDVAFNEENVLVENSYVLFLKSADEIVATYASTGMQVKVFVAGMQDENEGIYESVSIDPGKQHYSSCQWVRKDHRGKKLGMCLDHLKKNIVFDILNGDVNYAIHKEAFKSYHNDGLKYDTSSKLATIPEGDVGGAGEKIDKIYNVTWTTKSSWASKQDDVKKLYS